MRIASPYRTAPLLAIALAAPVPACLALNLDDTVAKLGRFFASARVVSGPDIVDCTLSGGTEARCFSITVKADPQDYAPGPWCPTHISDGAKAGGIWFHDGETVDVERPASWDGSAGPALIDDHTPVPA